MIKRLVLAAIIAFTLALGGCIKEEASRIDTSSIESAIQSTLSVFQDIAGDLLQGKTDLDTVNRNLAKITGDPELTVSKIIGTAKKVGSNVLESEQLRAFVEKLKNLDGMSAHDILKR